MRLHCCASSRLLKNMVLLLSRTPCGVCPVSSPLAMRPRTIKDYITKSGLRLSIEEFRPTRHEGSKEERIAASLEHRYDNLEVWHLEGGWTSILEEELVLSRPPHDDIKDALASAVSIAVPPAKSIGNSVKDLFATNTNLFNKRFGGVSF